MNILSKEPSSYCATEEPVPLPAGLPPVNTLLPEMLPDAIRGYVMDVSTRQQCPPDYCAVAAIVALSGVLGRKALLHPKQNDKGWVVTPNQWGALIGGPSAMKSPALKAMTFPLEMIEADLREKYENAVAEYEFDSELIEIERAAAKRKAKKKTEEGDREGARQELRKVKSATGPGALDRLVINDATVEALGERLNENPNGLILVRDELAGWLAKMNYEEYAADRAFYLECFNGDGRYTYDRIGRGTIHIQHCNLSIVGGIQPSKIAPIVKGAVNGVGDDGLIQRFQLAVWPDPLNGWQWIDRPADVYRKERYLEVFKCLHALEPNDATGEPTCWRFTSEAQLKFINWMEELHTEVVKGDLPSILASHLLKMPKTIGGLALLFAIIDGDHNQVGQDSTDKALAWASYLRSHAERLYSVVSDVGIVGANLIYSRRDKLPDPFTLRDVQRKQWTGLSDNRSVLESLEVLLDHRYVYERKFLGPQGHHKKEYYWNRLLLSSGARA